MIVIMQQTETLSIESGYFLRMIRFRANVVSHLYLFPRNPCVIKKRKEEDAQISAFSLSFSVGVNLPVLYRETGSRRVFLLLGPHGR